MSRFLREATPDSDNAALLASRIYAEACHESDNPWDWGHKIYELQSVEELMS